MLSFVMFYYKYMLLSSSYGTLFLNIFVLPSGIIFLLFYIFFFLWSYSFFPFFSLVSFLLYIYYFLARIALLGELLCFSFFYNLCVLFSVSISLLSKLFLIMSFGWREEWYYIFLLNVSLLCFLLVILFFSFLSLLLFVPCLLSFFKYWSFLVLSFR